MQKQCYIIAEAGINHNGNLDIAYQLIDKAIEANVDAIKFQTFNIEKLVCTSNSLGKKQADFLKDICLKHKDFIELKKYCDDKKIDFISTPFDDESALFLLEELKIDKIKIGSGDFTNLLLLEKIIEKNPKEIILSTGMSSSIEVDIVYNFICNMNYNNFSFLHCTTNYPLENKNANLNVITTYKNKYSIPIGYSDHTTNTLTASIAVSLGAEIIEKHFTLDKNMEGPDHKASLEPDELKEMVNNINITIKLLGNKNKKVLDSECENVIKAKKSIVSNCFIPKNTKITKNMITCKRPRMGIPDYQYKKIIDNTTNKDIKENEIITFEHIKNK